jgi:hypothetical protein
MRSGSRFLSATLISGIAFMAIPHNLHSQQPGSAPVAAAAGSGIPENPQPQFEIALDDLAVQQAPAAQNQTTPQPASTATPAQNPTSPQNPAAAPSQPAQEPVDQKSQPETAEEQLKQQEKQRVMGVMATFNTTTNKDALPLSPGQKFQLFFKGATDPWPFLLAGVVSGIGQADNSYPEWGQGAQGYAKRYGAAYSDAFIGNFFGNAVLPSLLREDPRYFQKGTGSATKRFLWAASSSFWCRRDNGRWGPNYANIGGNLIGSAIARAYYPASDRTVSDTISDGLTVSVEGIVGAEVIEFWPDMVRAHNRKKAEKLARAQEEAEEKAKQSQK